MKLSQSTLVSVIDYNPETGAMVWRRRNAVLFGGDAGRCAGWNTRYAGRPALQCADSEGYRHGSVLGCHVKAHRAAWIIVYGREPETIDHINHNKADNRIANLRDVANKENQRNQPVRRDNSSGATGVSLDKGRWRARIYVAGVERLLGYFSTFEEAAAARELAARANGFHENHGKNLETA